MVARIKTVVVVGMLCLAPLGRGNQANAQWVQEPPKATHLFTGKSLPAPPRQGQPWKAPVSKLPKKWGARRRGVAQSRFRRSRGCEYRQVELVGGWSLWTGSSLATTHAWVIPPGPGEKADSQRFAVTWDGLVYPLTKVGPAADLKADVAAIIAADDKWWKAAVERQKKRRRRIPKFAIRYAPISADGASSESELSFKDLLPLKSCTMFVLGEGELAERLWNSWKRGAIWSQIAKGPGVDPYLLFARRMGLGPVWPGHRRPQAGRRRDRHARRQNPRQIGSGGGDGRPQRGFRILMRPGPNVRKSPTSILSHYAAPERLLEDDTRRVKKGRSSGCWTPASDKFPDQPKRIAALIRDLEIAARTNE